MGKKPRNKQTNKQTNKKKASEAIGAIPNRLAIQTLVVIFRYAHASELANFDLEMTNSLKCCLQVVCTNGFDVLVFANLHFYQIPDFVFGNSFFISFGICIILFSLQDTCDSQMLFCGANANVGWQEVFLRNSAFRSDYSKSVNWNRPDIFNGWVR